MGTTRVVTDSTNYLSKEQLDRYKIGQVSLYVSLNGTQEREADISSYDAFYDQLGSSGTVATTSQPSIGDFITVWEPLLEAGHDIVSIHLAGGLSGTAQAAAQAKAQLEETHSGEFRITVIDSKTTCGGLGLVALAAAAAANAGASHDEVIERANGARQHLGMWFAIETLEYLKRGGRIGGAQAWVGTALKIKPILSVEEEIKAVEKVRTSKRAFARMVDFLHELHDNGSDAWAVQHIQAPQEANELLEIGREIMGCEPALHSEIGPVIGTHTGPGLVGVGGVPAKYLSDTVG